jgi:hypothetical protein
MPLTMHSHLPPRLKKEQSYSSTPNVNLHGLFYGENYGYFSLLSISLDTFRIHSAI